MKALFYLAVMMPLWSSYLVKVYAWKLLARQGRRRRLVHAGRGPARAARRRLSTPIDRRPVALGQLHRHGAGLPLSLDCRSWCCRCRRRWSVCRSRSSRPPATSAPSPARPSAHVILPLALPGVVAGSIFTFSLTLGDYIVPADRRPVVADPRPGRLHAAGHGRKHPARRRLLGRADRHHGRVPDDRQAHGGLRCAVSRERTSTAARRSACSSPRRRASLFLHVPLAFIILYAFTSEDRSFQFPPPGYTLHWFARRLGPAGYLGGAGPLAPVALAFDGCWPWSSARLPPPRWRGRNSSAARRSRSSSSCRSRFPASSPASRCAPPSTWRTSPSRSGPSSLATRRSASSSSTTTPSRASADCRPP